VIGHAPAQRLSCSSLAGELLSVSSGQWAVEESGATSRVAGWSQGLIQSALDLELAEARWWADTLAG